MTFSLLNDRSEEFSRSGVAFPDCSKFWDEVLYDGTKPGMEESDFFRGEKCTSRVLWRVSEQA